MQPQFFEQITDILPLLSPFLISLATVYLSCYLVIWIIERSGDKQLWALPGSIFKAVHHQLRRQTEQLTNKLLSTWAPPNLIFEALQPEKLVAESISTLSIYTDEFIDQMMQQQTPILWDNLPRFIRNQFYNEAKKALEPMVDNFIDQLQVNFSTLFQYPTFIPPQLDKAILLPIKLYTEGLIHYWKTLQQTGLLIALLLSTLYTISVYLEWLPFGIVAPVMLISTLSLSFAIFVCNPEFFTKRAKNQSKSTNQKTTHLWLLQKQTLNQLLSEQYGEHIVYFPDLIHHLLENADQQIKIRHMVRKSLLPLLEGLKLKIFTQLIAGPSALVALKNHATDNALEAIKFPLNNSQFIQKQSILIKQFLLSQANSFPTESLCALLQPLVNQISRWVFSISLITGFFLSMLYTLIS